MIQLPERSGCQERNKMIRKIFKMKVYTGMEKEYEERHQALWPEMKQMIHAYGGRNYTIALDPETDVLYAQIEIEDEKKWSSSTEDPINRKWWDYMADLMETNPDNSPVCVELEEVFHLD